LEVKDKKGTKNVVAYHLSRIINDEVTNKEREIMEEFSDEMLFAISRKTMVDTYIWPITKRKM